MAIICLIITNKSFIRQQFVIYKREEVCVHSYNHLRTWIWEVQMRDLFLGKKPYCEKTEKRTEQVGSATEA